MLPYLFASLGFLSHFHNPSIPLTAPDWRLGMIEKLSEPLTAQEYKTEFLLGNIASGTDHYFVVYASRYLQKRSLATHQVDWQLELEAESQASWMLDRESLYGADTKGFIYRVDVNTGEVVWKNQSKGIVFSKPVVRDDRVYTLNSYGVLQSYQRSDGQWQWQQQLDSGANIGLWSSQGIVSFGPWIVVGFPSGALYAYEPITGKNQWKVTFNVSAVENIDLNDVKSIAVSGDYLAAASFSGELRLWQRKGKGIQKLWEKSLQVGQSLEFSRDGGVLYVADRAGSLTAIDVLSGFARWNYQLPEGIASGASIGEEVIWFGSSVGEVFVLNKDGSLRIKSDDLGDGIYQRPVLIDDQRAFVINSRGNLREMKWVN